MDVASLTPLGRETRRHSPARIRKLRCSLEEFGFVLPLVVDARHRVVAGWGMVLAARAMGLERAPAVVLSDLSETKARALRLALNRLAEDGRWNESELKLEFAEILAMDAEFDLGSSGFDMAEIDMILDGDGSDEEDEVVGPEPGEPAGKQGDLWVLGEHRLYCGDSLNPESYARLLAGEKVDMMFADPPYNVAIDGNVSGLGRQRHGPFAMASGEMSPAEFERFLAKALGLAVDHSRDGALHFVCMDWRHLRELSNAGLEVYSELKSVCVWAKTNGGMGSLYRSRHELVFVYKVGTAAHVNNIQLGRYGRNRTNVWTYAGQTSLGGAKNKLALHPTVKPVALVADAIRDCSNRGDLVLDPFGGSGTTLIAAERAGRRARLIEYDPKYVDVAVARWERLTGRAARRLPAPEALNDAPPTDDLPLERYQGLYLGYHAETGKRLRYKAANLHAAIYGAPGAAKSAGLIASNIAHLQQSMIIVDVKGQLAAITARKRAKMGRVIIINPANLLVDRFPHLKSNGWQPPAQLNPKSPEFVPDADAIADAIITKGGDNGNAKFFDMTAENIVSLFVMHECAKNGDKADFRNIVTTLSHPFGFDDKTKKPIGALAVALQQMTQSDIYAVRTGATYIMGRLSDKSAQTTSLQDVNRIGFAGARPLQSCGATPWIESLSDPPRIARPA